MEARATFATNAGCSSRFTRTKAPILVGQHLWTGLGTQRSILTSTSYGKLRQFAPLYQTQGYTAHVRFRSPRSTVKAESRQTEEQQPKMVVEQFPLLLEVANVVPDDLDLNLCLEGEDIYGDCYMDDDYTNEYMKGRLSVQALLSEPELAQLWHNAESRAIPCLDLCLKALTPSHREERYKENLLIATLELFCEEVEGYFTSSTLSMERYVLYCLCLKVCWLMTDKPHLC